MSVLGVAISTTRDRQYEHTNFSHIADYNELVSEMGLRSDPNHESALGSI
jgi:hypothetical protein